MNALQRVVKTLGMAMLIAAYVLFIDIFIAAYRYPGGVCVTVNDYGEAKLELIMLILLFPCVIGFIYQSLKVTDGYK